MGERSDAFVAFEARPGGWWDNHACQLRDAAAPVSDLNRKIQRYEANSALG